MTTTKKKGKSKRATAKKSKVRRAKATKKRPVDDVRSRMRKQFNQKLSGMESIFRTKVQSFVRKTARRELNWRAVTEDPSLLLLVKQLIRDGATYREVEAKFGMVERNGMTPYDALHKPEGKKAIRKAMAA